MKERWIEVKFYWLVRGLYLKYNNLTAIEATIPLLNDKNMEQEVQELVYKTLTDVIYIPTKIETVHLQLKHGSNPVTKAASLTKIHRNTFSNYKEKISKCDIVYPTFYSDYERVIMKRYMNKIEEIGAMVL